MAFNQKLARMGQDILDALEQYKLTYGVSYNRDRDLQVTVTDTDLVNGGPTLLQFVKAPQLKNNLSNPVTGLVEDVFTPHIIQVMFSEKAAAFETVTVTGVVGGTRAKGTITGLNVLVGNTVVVGGHIYTCVATGTRAPGTYDFDFSGTSDADTMANLVIALNDSPTGNPRVYAVQDTVAPTKINLFYGEPGVVGNAITLANGAGLKFTVSGATLAGGVDGEWLEFNASAKTFALAAGELVWNDLCFLVGATDAATTASLKTFLNTSAFSAFLTAIDSAPPSATSLDLVSLTAGTGSNGLTWTDSGGGLHAVNGAWAGGTDTGTTSLMRAKILAECFTKGSQVDIYRPNVETGVPATDAFIDGNLLWSYRNLSWGNLSHM
jgi:hypothetical protein